MALTDLTRISTSGIATGTSLSGAILHGDAHFRGTQVGVTSALFDSSDNALEFNDDVKLKLGNSGDFEIYHRGADGVSIINETGSAYLSIGSNGNKVELYDTANGRAMAEFATGGACSFKHGATTRFQTTQTGAVVTGILTATGFSGPTNNTSGIATFYDLRVSNNLTVEGSTTTLDTNLIGVDRVEVGANSNTVVGVAITQSGTADIINLFDGATKVLAIDDTGKVGIGSAIPEGNLVIHGGAENPGLKLKRNTGGGDVASITWGSNSANFARINYRDAAPHGLQFYSGGTADSNLSMIIRLNGNVGIGSEIPSVKLDVAGNIKATGTITGSSFVGALPISNDGNDRVITATGTTGTLNAESNFTYNGTSCTIKGTTDGVLNLDTTDSRGSFIRFQQGGTTKVWVGSGQGLSLGDLDDLGLMATDNIIMRAGSDEKVRITSDGTVGINDTTPNTYFKLDVNGHTNIVGDIHLPTTNRISFGNSDVAWLRGVHGGSGYLEFGVNSAHMKLNRVGYLGINDTSGNARFIVSGNSDTSDADCQIRIYDTDTTVGSQIPSISFWGGSTQLAYIRGTSTGLRFYTGSSGTMSFAGSFDNSQRLLLGSDSNIAVAGSNPRVQVNGTSDSTAHLSIRNFSANTTGAILSLAKSRGGIGAYTAVADDDVLGQINFAGADGTDLAEVAGKITVACDATVAGNRVPSRMEFHTTDGNGNLDLNMVLTRDGNLYLPSGDTRDNMYSYCHSTANDFAFGKPSATADTGMTIVSNPAYSSFINFSDGSSGTRQGSILYQHGGSTDKMFFRTNNNQNALVIDSEQKIGVRTTEPQTTLNVIGTISTGRNVARELGTIINVSSSHDGSRVGGNVISGKKNYENGNQDWLAQGNARTNANLTIDLGSAKTCDRFVIYNQNEYDNSRREVKNFTLEGSNDNSSWTTLLDDDCGCSFGHEPNPGFSFRLPEGNIYGNDDNEGVSYRYWRFTMKTFHGSDPYGGIMELELYEVGDTTVSASKVGSEITTHSLVAGDISTQRMNGIQMLTSSEGLNIHTGEAASDTWEITETGIVTSGSYADKSTIRHKRGVMAVSSAYNSGDLNIRIDNIYNLPGNAWWTFGLWIMTNQTVGTLAGHHSAMIHVYMTGLGSWSSMTATDIQGGIASNVSVDSHGTNFVELKVDVNDSSRGPVTVLCNGGTFDPPRISFH